MDGKVSKRAAEVAHEANRVYCELIGDDSQVPWDEAPDWQKTSAGIGAQLVIVGVISGEYRPASFMHDSWLAEKEANGWVYGEEKDPEAKTHPCMVPYDELPAHQKLKDMLFMGAVLSSLATEDLS